jgi:hypothetical protein
MLIFSPKFSGIEVESSANNHSFLLSMPLTRQGFDLFKDFLYSAIHFLNLDLSSSSKSIGFACASGRQDFKHCIFSNEQNNSREHFPIRFHPTNNEETFNCSHFAA